jgi:predicted nucleic acid-binding protein
VSFLLDTNVLSEPTRPAPNAGLVEWLESTDEDQLFIGAATLAELHAGVQRLPDGKRKRHLAAWLRLDLMERFSGRILPINAEVAEAWGAIIAERQHAGRPISTLDAFVAATARAHRLTIVTRNTGDFEGTVATLNPWS